MIPPAVNGTLAVLKGCQLAAVRRCVITSSVAAVMEVAKADRPADCTFNESHWSNPERPEPMIAYDKSKTLAEKAAWDFVAALPEEDKFELVTILPGWVMGPPLRGDLENSQEWLKTLMEGTMTTIGSDRIVAVDVRDTAKAHLLGVKNAAAANRRFIIGHSTPSFQEYAAPVTAKYRDLGFPITENLEAEKPDEFYALFDNSASIELGVEYTDLSKTMVDMADKMVEVGSIVRPN